MIQNITKQVRGTRDVIKLGLLSGRPEWRYFVEAGTFSPRNTWACFYAQRVKVQDSYLLIGKREDHNIVGNERVRPTKPEHQEMLDPGTPYIGIARTEEEADEILIRKCQAEAERMHR